MGQLADVIGPVCSCLRSLDLRGNEIDDAGVAALARALPPTLEVLNLSANHAITDAGAASLARGVPCSSHAAPCALRQLDLSSFRGRRLTPLACPDDAPRTLRAVGVFVEFYVAADDDERRRITEREAALRAAQVEAAASAPPSVHIDGIECRRRLWCSTGTRMAEGWRLALAGEWTLAVDDPLMDGGACLRWRTRRSKPPRPEHCLSTGAASRGHTALPCRVSMPRGQDAHPALDSRVCAQRRTTSGPTATATCRTSTASPRCVATRRCGTSRPPRAATAAWPSRGFPPTGRRTLARTGMW
jgi:hypothetical protein